MTKLTQQVQQTGYSLGGLSRQFIEDIESEFFNFEFPFDTKK